MPAGRGHHPLARLGARDAFGNGLLHVGDGARAEKLHRRAVQRREQLMQVGIDQAGHDGLAGKLDHLRVRTDVAGDRGVVADGEKAPILDGDGLRDAPVLVDRDDLAAAQHEIGGLREGRSCESECDKEREEKRNIETVTHRRPLAGHPKLEDHVILQSFRPQAPRNARKRHGVDGSRARVRRPKAEQGSRRITLR